MSWQIYTQYDEDSLIMHSNAGLLRRARKALNDVELLQQSANQLLFKVEECEVQLPEEGITKAQCNCPAQGCCKHILSSILWVQENVAQFSTNQLVLENTTESAIQQQSSNTSVTPEHTTASAKEQLLDFDPSKIQKQAGKANIRLAYEFIQNWLAQPEQCQIDIQDNKISFQTDLSPDPVLLYPATGFEGILSEINHKQKIAGHLACVAYFFLQYAPEKWQWSIDLNEQQNNPNQQLALDDREFIEELKTICQNFIQHGLSHLAKENVMSLHILNMQARAQNLPRLGSLLRTLHGTMRQFLEDDIQVDEQQIYNQLAHLYAYLTALSEIESLNPEFQTEALTKLRGVIKRDYQNETIAHLIPLGCEWWSTDSGAHGLTVCFWDVSEQQLKEVTQARANHLDRTFDMHSAANTGIWGSSLSFLLQHQLELTHAKSSSDTQLSASTDTRFLQKGSFNELTISDLDQMNIGVSEWQTLQEMFVPHSSLEQLKSRYVLLRHRSINAPELNELEQYFEYRVTDQQDIALKLVIPIEAEYRVRIKHLTHLIQNEKILATLVRVETTQQQLQFIPCSVIWQSSKGLKIFSLDYDHPIQKKSSLAELITGRIEKLLEQKKQWQKQQHLSALEVLVLETQTLLEFYANTGRSQFDRDDQDKLNELAQQFADLGLSFIRNTLQMGSTQDALATQLLKWRHVLLQLQRLNQRIVLEGQVTS
ncbi:SWIM zinc finger domain-containing protein [Acinetobacter bereziniae]|uniref:SWIM zinc finger domain-containing protein n=1 Tax=Acinetobacter bereziniae TaxID=106648 RepID=UPI0018DDD7D7|nr:SWIM zinc finger domain-containing protein [Acinetobacter bereziniae]MBI0395367.1 SWIM zinc finger family protein [Acinetobacter bereziniae]